MRYAKFNDKYSISEPSKEDFDVDGVTLKNPELWLEYIPSERPLETAIYKYRDAYSMEADMFQGPYKIYQVWESYIVEPTGRVAKLKNGNQLIFPSQSEILADGTLICNFDRLPNSKKLEYGYYLVIEAEHPSDGKKYQETGILVDDPDFGKKIRVVLKEIIPESEPPFDISKLKLKRAMDSLGKWESFLSVLKSNPSAFEDFNLAVSLMSNDSMVLQFKGICVQMFGFTEDQIDMMLKQCRSDI